MMFFNDDYNIDNFYYDDWNDDNYNVVCHNIFRDIILIKMILMMMLNFIIMLIFMMIMLVMMFLKFYDDKYNYDGNHNQKLSYFYF